MLFNSIEYIIFLPIVFAVYWMIPDSKRWLLLWVVSYFFYMCWNPKYILLLLFTTGISYICARVMERQADKAGKKRTLILGLVCCLGVLFVYKYLNFSMEIVGDIFNLFSVKTNALPIDILLPVGISFYTFQTVSYLADVYRGEVKAEHNFGVYAAFISFFPQLVAGPIERTGNLLKQIKGEHIFSYENATYGLKRIAWGYFKKCVIADTVAIYVDIIYNNVGSYTGFSLLLATILFAIQIYCDFSGYSDIALGSAKLLGINLTENFRCPYMSTSVKEFWSRWHISLSSWFRDYVYIPLGGNRVSKWKRDINLLITFLASGLWPGAAYTYVVWGGLHGLYQIIENHIPRRAKKQMNIPERLLKMLFIFGLICFAWIFFRASSLDDAIYVIVHMFDGIPHLFTYIRVGLNDVGINTWANLLQLIGILGVLTLYDAISLKTDVFVWLGKQHWMVRWITYITLGLTTILLAQKGINTEFVYFQF